MNLHNEQFLGKREKISLQIVSPSFAVLTRTEDPEKVYRKRTDWIFQCEAVHRNRIQTRTVSRVFYFQARKKTFSDSVFF